MAVISRVAILFAMLQVLNGLQLEYTSPEAKSEVQAESKGLPGQEATAGQGDVEVGRTLVANGIDRLKESNKAGIADAELVQQLAKAFEDTTVDTSVTPKPKPKEITRSKMARHHIAAFDDQAEPSADLIPPRSSSVARSNKVGKVGRRSLSHASQQIVAMFFLIVGLQAALFIFAEKEAKRLWAFLRQKFWASKGDEAPAEEVQEVELVEVPPAPLPFLQVPKLISLPPGHPALAVQTADDSEDSATELLKPAEATAEDSSVSVSAVETRPTEQALLKDVSTMLDEVSTQPVHE